MPGGLVTRRTQFSSCDECRRSRVACDAAQSRNAAAGEAPASCTRCRNRHKSCTFKWIQDAKASGGGSSSGAKRKGRRRIASHPSSDTSSTQGSRASVGNEGFALGSERGAHRESLTTSVLSTPFVAPSPTYSTITAQNTGLLSDADSKWFGHNLADKYVSISDLCCHLDGCMTDAAANNGQSPGRGSQRRCLIEQSLQSTIASFSARWLPISSRTALSENDYRVLVQALWRHARRDMLRIINRPSYRSMLSLLLFALTPIPDGISEEEEADGISGQACVHAALQQIQTLRARQKNLQFSGSKVSPSLKSQGIVTTPESIETSGFINAESTAYWAALTFDTSASLTLNCRPLLSSGLFGFESELPWRLVRTCAKMFDETAQHWSRGSSDMTDERANQIIAAGASWKLLGWKLTAIFKEALRDGHDESEVRKAYLAVVDSIKQFGTVYRPMLDECHKRMQFLGQQTKLRWFSLMLHYHLSILMLVDVIEVTDRHDLLADIADISTDAENTVMNTLAFGLHNTFTLRRPPDPDTLGQEGARETTFTVPIVSIDPYPHHAVAGVQLLRKAIDRDFGVGKITDETYQSLLSTLERTLKHLPQSSKSVQAAIAKFSSGAQDEADCVPEQLALKQKVIVELDSLAGEDTIIASNSSSYSCSEILEGITLKNERRFLSAHSYWPPETPEIEIMGHETTNPSYIPLMMEQCKAHGFSPFEVKSPSMGYIYNRIWAAIKREALLAASEGVATPEEIDAMFKGVLKTPKGPFEQMDVVGLDVVLDIEQHYADARGDIPSAPREYLQKFLQNGHLGVKSGRGFYDYGSS
ncbi:hypothetical protein LRP88_12129 [Fusarium phalaenopsidis]